MRLSLRDSVGVALILSVLFASGCTTADKKPSAPASSSSTSVTPSTTAPSTAAAFPRWTTSADYKAYSQGAVSYLAGLVAELGKPISPKKLTIKFFAAGEETKEVNCGDNVYLNLATSVPHIAFCGGGLMVFETGFKKVSDENQIVSTFTWAIADAAGKGNDASTTCVMGAMSKAYANNGTALDIAASNMNLAYEGDANYTKGRQNGVNACG